ncbi:MAG: tRNA pseudouridine(55) synthase TruB [Armatimonadota bacterium]
MSKANAMHWMGLLNICKLPGTSSHGVVSRVRKIADMRRVGHTGTLDPMACGVLPICVGPATRLADYIAAGPKTYRAEILFGMATDTADAEGQLISHTPASNLTEEQVTGALAQFTGTIMQCPPIHSAIQLGGLRAYDMARRGEEVVIPAREVTVYAFTPVRYLPGVHPRLLADIVCSKGTYIRSLASDLGEALGVGALLSFLARTQVGDCLLENALTIDEVDEAGKAGRFAEVLRSPDSALTHLPVLHLPAAAERYRFGNEAPLDAEPALYRIYWEEQFLGLGRVEEGRLRAVVNFQ